VNRRGLDSSQGKERGVLALEVKRKERQLELVEFDIIFVSFKSKSQFDIIDLEHVAILRPKAFTFKE